MGERGHGDAVSRPRTVVVHLGDAPLAKAAVVGAGRLGRLTLLAPSAAVLHLNHLLREDISAWVNGDSFEIGVVEDGEEGVKDYGFLP